MGEIHLHDCVCVLLQRKPRGPDKLNMLTVQDDDVVILDTDAVRCATRQSGAADSCPGDAVHQGKEYIQQTQQVPLLPVELDLVDVPDNTTKCGSDKVPMRTEVIYTCGMCSTSGLNAEQYFGHMSAAHGIKYFCGLCEAGKRRPRQLLAHHALSHPLSEVYIKTLQGNELQDVLPETVEGWLENIRKRSRAKQKTVSSRQGTQETLSPESSGKPATKQVKRKRSTLNKEDSRKKAKIKVAQACCQPHEDQDVLDAHLRTSVGKACSQKCMKGPKPKQGRRKSVGIRRVHRSIRQALTGVPSMKGGRDRETVAELTKLGATSVEVSERNCEAPLPVPSEHVSPIKRRLRRRAKGESNQKESDSTRKCVKKGQDDRSACVLKTGSDRPSSKQTNESSRRRMPEVLQRCKNSPTPMDGASLPQPLRMDLKPKNKESSGQGSKSLPGTPSPELGESVRRDPWRLPRRSSAEECLQAPEASQGPDDISNSEPSSGEQTFGNTTVISHLSCDGAKLHQLVMLYVPGTLQVMEKKANPMPRRSTVSTTKNIEVITPDDDDEQEEGLQDCTVYTGCQTASEACTPRANGLSSLGSGEWGSPQPYSFYDQSVEPISYDGVDVYLRDSGIKVSYQQLAEIVPLQPKVVISKLTVLLPHL